MNKAVTIILIILLSLVTIALTGIFILLMKGDFNFNFASFFNIGYSENLVDSKEYDMIEDIVINCDIADVFIEEGNEGKIKVELYSEDSEDYFIKEENNKIMVKLNAKKNKIHFGGKQNKVLVTIPKDYENKIKIKTATGDTKVQSFANMKLEVDGTTGDIKIDEIDRLDFEMSTGDIKADNLNYISGKLTTGDIKIGKVEEFSAATSTGDIVIENVSKRIYAKTTTGDVKIDRASLSEDSTVKTSTGDVKIESLEGVYVEASASTGDIKVNNNDRHAEKTITISTSTGDIRVN